jgi:hypothetical protein
MLSYPRIGFEVLTDFWDVTPCTFLYCLFKDAMNTEQVGSTVTLLTFFRNALSSNLSSGIYYLTEDFRGFPQCLLANIGRAIPLGNDRVFPNPLKFNVHKSTVPFGILKSLKL